MSEKKEEVIENTATDEKAELDVEELDRVTGGVVAADPVLEDPV
jgi:hypothetical protein